MEEWIVDIVRSNRRSLSLQIKSDGHILVRAPKRMPQSEIRRFIDAKADWIRKHLEKVAAANASAEAEPIDRQELLELAREAQMDLQERTIRFSERMGVRYGRITIRNQKTRWGSCSAEGNLNYNCLLMLAPEEIRDYVVVHELAHRKHMDHSAAFWKEVADVLPDYKQRVKWLKDNGPVLLARMRIGEKE